MFIALFFEDEIHNWLCLVYCIHRHISSRRNVVNQSIAVAAEGNKVNSYHSVPTLGHLLSSVVLSIVQAGAEPDSVSNPQNPDLSNVVPHPLTHAHITHYSIYIKSRRQGLPWSGLCKAYFDIPSQIQVVSGMKPLFKIP